MEVITPEEQKIYDELIINLDDKVVLNSKLRVLSKDEVIYLSKLKDLGSREAFNKLFYHNLRLVNLMIKKYSCYGVAQSDLFQIGCIGLIKAIEKYDYNKGYRFSTYATKCIIRTLNKSLIDNYQTIRLPVHIYDEVINVRKIIEKIYAKTGENPTEAEIADCLGVSIDKVEKILSFIYYNVSLDDSNVLSDKNDDYVLYDILPNERAENPEKTLIEIDFERLGVLDVLTPLQRQVIELLYGFNGKPPMRAVDVAKMLNTKSSNIDQLRRKAFVRLMKCENMKHLVAYLDNPDEALTQIDEGKRHKLS